MQASKPGIANSGAKLNKCAKPQFRNFKKHGTNIKFEGHITDSKDMYIAAVAQAKPLFKLP